MKIIYRISEAGYNKVKPYYISNESCLENFCNVFSAHVSNIQIIADNIKDTTYDMICKYVDESNIKRVSVGHGAGTFNLALDEALKEEESEIIYFVENDYVHKPGADIVLKEGIMLGSDFVTLYDHPDKYMINVNPYVEDGGEVTKVYLTDNCHWKLTNSTTMTFASTVKNLKASEATLRKWTVGNHPHDFEMWIELRNLDKGLISSIPGFATHGESAWLAPLINWDEYVNSKFKS